MNLRHLLEYISRLNFFYKNAHTIDFRAKNGNNVNQL